MNVVRVIFVVFSVFGAECYLIKCTKTYQVRQSTAEKLTGKFDPRKFFFDSCCDVKLYTFNELQ